MQTDPSEIQKLTERVKKLESKHESHVQLILSHATIIATDVAITLMILKSLSLIKF
jgi:hypothetical protein